MKHSWSSHPMSLIRSVRYLVGVILIESHKPNGERSLCILAGGLFSVYSFQSKRPSSKVSPSSLMIFGCVFFNCCSDGATTFTAHLQNI